jgi:DNA-binding PadR family transcriptional regulator
MKQGVSHSIGYFWSFPHSQLYAEPARLAAAGLLAEQREPTGRRKRSYTLTPAGRHALQAWLGEPTDEPTEIRDLALLKLFFASQASREDVVAIAKAAAAAHRARLDTYESLFAARWQEADRHHITTLELGLRYERTVVAFWEEVAVDPDGVCQPTRPAPTNSDQ